MVVDKKVRVELQVCLLFSTEAGKVQSLCVRLGLKFSRMIQRHLLSLLESVV